MNIDRKYQITAVNPVSGKRHSENDSILFLAKDAAVLPMLETYHATCAKLGSNEEHLDSIRLLIERVEVYQEHGKSKVPDTVGAEIDRCIHGILEPTAPKAKRPHSHYFKDVSKLSIIDIYRVCSLFDVQDPSGATQHALKKLMLPGQRGGKSMLKDLTEARDTLNRRIEMLEEDEAIDAEELAGNWVEPGCPKCDRGMGPCYCAAPQQAE